jgi:hypothetical protein
MRTERRKERWTDRTQLIVGFRNFATVPKINYEYEHHKRVINCGLLEEWNVEDLQRDRLKKILMATMNKTSGIILQPMTNTSLTPGL